MLKKGATHIGVVLSFVIFVTFLVFLYTTLQPAVRQDRDKQIILDTLKPALVESISGELTEVSIKTNPDQYPQGAGFDCIQIPKINDEIPGTMKMITKIVRTANLVEEITESETVLNNEIKINVQETSDDKFKIYFSNEELSEITPNCSVTKLLTQKGVEYEIGSIRTTNYIFKTKVAELMENYGSDYALVKSDLGIPEDSEFGFTFESQDGTTINAGETPETASIFAEELAIQYVNETASINTGFLRIRVW